MSLWLRFSLVVFFFLIVYWFKRPILLSISGENWNPLYVQSIKGWMDYYKTTVILQVTFMNDLHKVHILLLISLSSMLNTLASSFSNLREQHVTLEYKSILVITKHLAKLWPIIEKSIGPYWGSMDQLPISSPHLQTEQSTGPHNWWILLLNIFYILAGPETCTCWSAEVLWDCA